MPGGLQDRIASALAAGRRAVSTAGEGAQPVTAAWALVHLGDSPIGPALDAHAARCEALGFRCVVLSDRFPPDLLGRPRIVFEHLPLDVPPAGGTDTPDLRSGYLFRRFAHVVAFWNVVGITWAGDRAAALRDAAPPDAPPVIRSVR